MRKLPEAVVGSLLMVLIAAVSVTVGTVAVFGWTGALLNFDDASLVGDEDILLSATIFANLFSCLFPGAGFFAVSDDVGCSVERLEWAASTFWEIVTAECSGLLSVALGDAVAGDAVGLVAGRWMVTLIELGAVSDRSLPSGRAATTGISSRACASSENVRL